MVSALKTNTKYSYYKPIQARVLYAVLCFFSALPCAFAETNNWNKIQIPEPLLFDLIRPLGASKGELEFNILGTKILNYKNNQHRNDSAVIRPPEIVYAPEVEYAFADGYGIELELPFANHKLEAYKLALQGTFSRSPFERSINGWQLISLYNRLEKESNVTGLYLLGVQFSERISSLVMLGANVNDHFETGLIANPSLFFKYSDALTFGIENNLFLSANEHYYILLPQMEYSVGTNISVQLGAGLSIFGDHEHMLAAMRLIYTC